MEVFNYSRVYSLTVGSAPDYIITSSGVQEELNDVTLQGNSFVVGDLGSRVVEVLSAVEVRDLQMQANVKNNSESSGEAGTTTIKVFNVPREKLQILSKKNNYVILKAGYEPQLDGNGDYSKLPLIFSGQVTNAVTEAHGADIVTTLVCKDGFVPSTSIKISVNLPPNRSVGIQTYQSVFDKLITIWKANGVATSDDSVILSTPIYETGIPNTFDPIEGLSPDSVSLDNGWSYEGFLSDAMDDLCVQFNYTWYIHNNKLYIHSKRFKDFIVKYTFKNTQILDIRSASDVRGIPTEGTATRIKVKTLLDGRLSMGNLLEVEDGDYRGTYSIKSISYRLDWRGKEWYNEVEAEAVT